MSFRVWNLAEVADYLHLAKSDVERLVKRDEIPFERQGERLVFRRREIDEWASRRVLGMKEEGLSAFHKKTSAKYYDLSPSASIIPELLTPERIQVSTAWKTKSSVIYGMVDLADASGLVNNREDLLNSLLERERLCSTALTGGLALLHPRNHEPYMFEDSFLALGRTIQPVPFGSPDRSTTDIFFLVCCQDDRIHLHVLARLCMMCHHTSMLLELREAETAKDAMAIVLAAEQQVISGLK